MMDKTAQALIDKVAQYGKTHPKVWKEIERANKFLREGLGGKAQVNIPNYVHIPMICWSSFLFSNEQAMALKNKEPTLVNGMLMIAALGSWRLTQGVYRFDLELGQSLSDTPWEGKIAWEQLLQMPEWCIYIEDPNFTAMKHDQLQILENRTIRGYFLHLDCDIFQDVPILRIIVDYDDAYMTAGIPLGDWTLDEAIDKLSLLQHESFLGTYSNLEAIFNDKENGVRLGLQRILSFAYYICSQYAELGQGSEKPKRPQPVKTKKGMTYFPPDKPKVWDVGAKLGRALRAAKEREQQEYEQSGDKLRNRPRPHIRRAHWHTFLSGPRTEQQKRMVKWIPPTGVNLEYGEVIPTIYPIKENA